MDLSKLDVMLAMKLRNSSFQMIHTIQFNNLMFSINSHLIWKLDQVQMEIQPVRLIMIIIDLLESSRNVSDQN